MVILAPTTDKRWLAFLALLDCRDNDESHAKVRNRNALLFKVTLLPDTPLGSWPCAKRNPWLLLENRIWC